MLRIGTGTASSYLVIQAPAFGTLFYEVFYNFNPSIDLDSYYLLGLVDAALPQIQFDISNFGSPESPNYFLNGITYNGTTLTGVSAPPFEPFWYQSVSGGENGYPTVVPIASGAWQEGGGLSYRYITPGSWDGFVYGSYGDAPTIAPVPEPGVYALLVIGGKPG